MTAAALEKRLRLLFAATPIRWQEPAERSHFANITMDKGAAYITMPQGFGPYYTLMKLIHELSHKAIPGELAAFGEMEEDILERVVEDWLWDHIVRRPRKHEWWINQMVESGWLEPRKGRKRKEA